MTKRRLAILFAAFLLPSFILASNDWIIAAEPFSWESDTSSEEQVKAAAVQIPSLVLDYLSNSGFRVPSLQELQQRKLDELKKARPSLVAALEKALKSRDEVLFSVESESEFKKEIEKKDLAVEEAKKNLEENQRQTRALLEEIKTNESDNNYVASHETVRLWKDSSSTLLQVPENTSLDDMLAKEKINALVSGTMTVFGGYAVVQVQLAIYPGAIVAGNAEQVGSLSDIVSLAKKLAEQLEPFVLNTSSVTLSFSVLPEQAACDAVVLLDGQITPLSQIPSSGMVLSSGEHTITVESQGFYPKSFTWNFSEGNHFLATVNLEEQHFVELHLQEEGENSGQVYVNALPVGQLPTVVQVSKGVSLGEFVPTNKDDETFEPSFFTLDVKENSDLEQLNARIKAETEDISARIEKRRRTMYNSYSALLVSLVPTIVSYGMYVTNHNAWALGYGEESKAKTWNTVSNVALGLTGGLAVNFVVQLGLYIAAANDVLPENADLDEE